MRIVIERCGRVCYKSEDRITPDSSGAFVRRIIASGHHSVLEHASATVLIVADRGLTHELVRHRIGSYSQESTRYCNYGKGGEIAVCPMNDGMTSEQLSRREALWLEIESVYLAEVAEGVKPQQARDVLPTCLKTEIAASFNFREWRHVFSLRCAQTAHPRIRAVMKQVLYEFFARWPCVFGDQAGEFL